MSGIVDRKFPAPQALADSAATGAACLPHGPTAGEKSLGIALVLLIKPGIVTAVLLAGYAGMVLAARGLPETRTALVTLSALFLASAGSALVNGIVDAPLDERMARLRDRTAALARIGRLPLLAAALAGITLALLIALRMLNPLVAMLLLTAVLSYTLVYTLFLKRRSPWGAIPGGIPGALPVLVGYAAVNPALGADAIILFAVLFLWQPPHFWGLALEYRREYTAAGIPVLPEIRGRSYTVLLYFVYAASLLPASLALWKFGYCSAWYAGAALIAWLAFITVSCRFLIAGNRPLPAFAASIGYLLALLLAVIGDVCVFSGRLP
jgi:heme o synthase